MSALTFSHDRAGVLALDGGRSYRLDANQVERLLSIFDEAGAIRPFLALHDAYMAVGGIERPTSMRAA